MKTIFILLLCIIIFFTTVFFINSCNTIREEKLETVMTADTQKFTEDLDENALNELNGGFVNIIYDSKTDIPKQIDGIFSTKKIETAEDALYAMMSVRTFMKIHGVQFACIDSNLSEDDINTFVFTQVYEGIAVDNCIFRIVADKDGTPRSVYGIYGNDIEINTVPSIPAKAGIEFVTLSEDTRISSYQLVIYKKNSEYFLSWKYKISSKDPLHEKYVYIDAHTGQLVADIPNAIS